MQNTSSTRNHSGVAEAAPRVLVATEDEGLRSDLRTVLRHGGLVEVVTEVGSNENVIRAAGAFCPDVIILSAGKDPDRHLGLVRQLMKNCSRTHLLLLGETPMAEPMRWETVVRATAKWLTTTDPPPPAPEPAGFRPPPAGGGAIRITILTSREREVLQLVASGFSSKEIADKLSISVRTVESHRNQIMNKLRLRSVAELTKYAIRQGLTGL